MYLIIKIIIIIQTCITFLTLFIYALMLLLILLIVIKIFAIIQICMAQVVIFMFLLIIRI